MRRDVEANMCACQSTYKNSFTKIPNYVMLRGKSNSKIVDPASERTPISDIFMVWPPKKLLRNYYFGILSHWWWWSRWLDGIAFNFGVNDVDCGIKQMQQLLLLTVSDGFGSISIRRALCFISNSLRALQHLDIPHRLVCCLNSRHLTGSLPLSTRKSRKIHWTCPQHTLITHSHTIVRYCSLMEFVVWKIKSQRKTVDT